MDWEELLAEFRSLGGVFENLRLGTGDLGRGVFVVDPAKPALLHVSRNLLFPIDDVAVCGGHLRLKPESAAGTRERAFFETYQRSFGWSAGLFDEIERQQTEWNALPIEVKRSIITMGAIGEPEKRFREPTVDVCLNQYVETRDLYFEGKAYIAPVLEIVNHSPRGRDYGSDDGLSIAGTFENEVLARYNVRDAWAVALHYGFAHRSPYAYSLAIAVDIYARKRLVIDRQAGGVRQIDGVRFPIREDDGNVVKLTNMMLGNANGMDLPRAVFRKLMKDDLTPAQADEVFDGIAFYNRGRFLDTLTALEKYEGSIVSMLRSAAVHQLHALSACVGAREL
ncbi:MAG TPA: hypothetical protein VFE36_03180 [Candidatus Baltobacteraceae bacterium]|jgi:hypothetical protein|nr:hypothetical protein [Candidatus Baltobacteraceae bacterium]